MSFKQLKLKEMIENIERKREALLKQFQLELRELDLELQNLVLELSLVHERKEEELAGNCNRYYNIKIDVLPKVISLMTQVPQQEISVQTLFEQLELQYGIRYKNPSVVIKHLMKYEPRIQKSTYGCYRLVDVEVKSI